MQSETNAFCALCDKSSADHYDIAGYLYCFPENDDREDQFTPALPSEPEVKPTRRNQLTHAQLAVLEEFEYPYAEAIRREMVKDDTNVFAMAVELTQLRARCAQLEGDAKLIDFVQANHYSVMCWDVNGKINNGFTIGSDNGEMDDIAAGRTWRECVAWAMKRAARSTPTASEAAHA